MLCHASRLLGGRASSRSSPSSIMFLRALRSRVAKPLLSSEFSRKSVSPSTPPAPSAVGDEAAEAIMPVTEAAALVEKPVTFENLGLDSFITNALRKNRVTAPTPIQAATYPLVMQGKDVAIKSYTGSGKTLAYLLPVLQQVLDRLKQHRKEGDADYMQAAVRAKVPGILCLVVAPTADLAMQIVRSARSAVPAEVQPLVQSLIGGANFRRQVDLMKKTRPWIVVGTPGRLADMSRQGEIFLHPIPMLIIDEADQLLSSVYRDDMQRIAEHVGRKVEPSGRQTVLVSATITPAGLRVAQNNDWCKMDTEIVSTVSMDAVQRGERPSSAKSAQWGWNSQEEKWSKEAGEMTEGAAGGVATDDVVQAMPPNLTHLFMRVPQQHRVDRVRRCLHAVKAEHALIFMNFQRRLQDTEVKLAARNMDVGSLHGDMSAQERKTALDRFRLGKLRALVVSDLAARGIDFPECDVVINLELPSSPSHYVHRAGRAGRAGREGVVITMVTSDQAFVVDKWARDLKTEFIEVEAREGTLVPIEDALEYRPLNEEVADGGEARRERSLTTSSSGNSQKGERRKENEGEDEEVRAPKTYDKKAIRKLEEETAAPGGSRRDDGVRERGGRGRGGEGRHTGSDSERSSRARSSSDRWAKRDESEHDRRGSDREQTTSDSGSGPAGRRNGDRGVRGGRGRGRI